MGKKGLYGYYVQIQWGVSSTALVGAVHAHVEQDLSAVLVLRAPATDGSVTGAAAAAPLLRHRHRFSTQMYEGKINSSRHL